MAVALWVLWVRLSRDRFWCLVVSCVVVLVLGEIVCRMLGIGAPERFIAEEAAASAVDAPYPYEPNSELVYTYSSNPRGYFDSENRVVGHINSQGFRGGEPRQDAGADLVRICMLGDSFALGFGVWVHHFQPNFTIHDLLNFFYQFMTMLIITNKRCVISKIDL